MIMIGESNVAIDPAIPTVGGYGGEDIYLGEFSPHWVQQVHNHDAAVTVTVTVTVVARSLGCQCDTEIPTGRTLTET